MHPIVSDCVWSCAIACPTNSETRTPQIAVIDNHICPESSPDGERSFGTAKIGHLIGPSASSGDRANASSKIVRSGSHARRWPSTEELLHQELREI